MLPALGRSLAIISRAAEYDGKPVAFLHADEGGGGVVVACQGTSLTIRNLLRGDWWHGERGVRTLLETLLACEDRYPNLVIEGLVGVGKIGRDWLKRAGEAARLALLPSPTPPPGIPTSMLPADRWLIPYGALAVSGI